MKKIVALAFVWIFEAELLAQTPLASNRAVVHTAPISTGPPQHLHILPLFGEYTKTPQQKQQDERFFVSCDKAFGSRQEAAKFFAERGWEYLAEGEQDTAIYRFNLAYLLNPQNTDAYWGLGVVTFQQGKFDESARLLNRGLLLDPKNPILMVDVATVQINCFKEKRHCEDLEGAIGLLQKAVSLDSTNANTFLKLAVAEYHNQNFDGAWSALHRCRLLDLSMVDSDFLQELLSRREDPLGLFKKQ
jgi:lipopolysaccharide biosynthesis regulator YciM